MKRLKEAKSERQARWSTSLQSTIKGREFDLERRKSINSFKEMKKKKRFFNSRHDKTESLLTLDSCLLYLITIEL